MTKSAFKKYFITVSAGALLVFLSCNVQAGFQIKGNAAPAPAPLVPQEMSKEMPQEIKGSMGVESFPAPICDMPTEKVMPVQKEVVQQQKEATPILEALPLLVPAPEVAQEVGVVEKEEVGEALVGFASDIPLVMALQQVVPAGYQTSFAKGVNPGISVSWNGGRAWQPVLKDMLGAQGLGYTLKNNVVVITEAEAPTIETEMRIITGTETQTMEGPVVLTTPLAEEVLKTEEKPLFVEKETEKKPQKIVDIRREKTFDFFGAFKKKQAEKEKSAPKEALKKMPTLKIKTVDSNVSFKPETEVERTASKPTEIAIELENHKANKKITKQELPKQTLPKPAEVTKDIPLAAEPVGAPVKVDVPESLAPIQITNDQLTNLPQVDVPEVKVPAPALPLPSVVTVAPATEEVAVTLPAAPQWKAEKGATLRDILSAWSASAGVELYWSIDYDYRLAEDTSFAGSYDEVVSELLELFASARPQPFGQLHQPADGTRVLVIKSYDLTR